MQVSGYEVFAVANPVPGAGGPVWLFVRLDVDDAWSGYGEISASALYLAPRTVVAAVEDLLEHFALGADAEGIEALVHRVRNSHYSRTGELFKTAVLSAVECALWDALGKARERPVHALLGGRVRESVRMYSYLSPPSDVDSAAFWADDDAIGARTAALAALGFSALKLDPFPLLTGAADLEGQLVPVQPTRDALSRAERIVRAVRAAAPDLDVMIGTHGQFTAAGAVRVADRLAPFDPLWFEEPVPPELLGPLAQVVTASRIPVAAGERVASLAGFAALLEAGVGILNPDVCQAGGLLETRKVAALAEAHGAQITPHVYGGPIAAAASLHLALTVPNLLILEGNGVLDGPHADLLVDPLDWSNGRLRPSDRPGFGHDLDEDRARAWAVTDEQLQVHLVAAATRQKGSR